MGSKVSGRLWSCAIGSVYENTLSDQFASGGTHANRIETAGENNRTDNKPKRIAEFDYK